MKIMRDRRSSVKTQERAGADSTASRQPIEAVAVEGTNVLFDVWLVSRGVHGLLDAALAPSGLTADEFGIYSVLTKSESMTPSELGRWMSAPLTTVSSYVKRLEGRGHVRRERNPLDGRSYVLRLTPEGRAAHRAAGACFLPVLDDVVDALGRAEPGVRRAFGTLRDAVERVTTDSTRS
jgi:DNA-binding MarR family transcriptional regulator